MYFSTPLRSLFQNCCRLSIRPVLLGFFYLTFSSSLSSSFDRILLLRILRVGKKFISKTSWIPLRNVNVNFYMKSRPKSFMTFHFYIRFFRDDLKKPTNYFTNDIRSSENRHSETRTTRYVPYFALYLNRIN